MKLELEQPSGVSIDACHAALLYGVVTSLKPKKCLELGIGAGYASNVILDALAYNGRGRLTCVDSFYDWGGSRPGHIDALEARGASVIVSDEQGYLLTCQSHYFDLLVSDADHVNSGSWAYDHIRIMNPHGIAFFHDTANPDYPGLRRIGEALKASGVPFREFKESTRPDERCGRGWLMAVFP